MGTVPNDILESAYREAVELGAQPAIGDIEIVEKLENIARNTANRACARFLIACTLAKIDNPSVDIRKPYTEIGGDDTFSGRTYDERYITDFVRKYTLLCNQTTAFLTPAFRNRNSVLTTSVNLVGRPPSIYKATLEVLGAIHSDKVSTENVLVELLRWLIVVRNEKKQRVQSLLAALKASSDENILSAESIVLLIEQHLSLKRSSRLPVLVVAAAYQAAQSKLGEGISPLQSHNAADRQSGSLGDLEITLVNDRQIMTSYEMKTRKVTKEDIAHALDKITASDTRPDNYIFITTKPISDEVQEYAKSLYDETAIEFVVLDCIGFLRHFLHFFYRIRMVFLEEYQELLLSEPGSAVSEELKEAFLSMRQVAQSPR